MQAEELLLQQGLGGMHANSISSSERCRALSPAGCWDGWWLQTLVQGLNLGNLQSGCLGALSGFTSCESFSIKTR